MLHPTWTRTLAMECVRTAFAGSNWVVRLRAASNYKGNTYEGAALALSSTSLCF